MNVKLEDEEKLIRLTLDSNLSHFVSLKSVIKLDYSLSDDVGAHRGNLQA